MWEFVDLGEAAQRLRDQPEVNDVAAVRSPEGRLYVLVQAQGFVDGAILRDLVFDELETEHPDLAAAWVRAVPRTDTDGAVDPVEAIALAQKAADNSRWVFEMVAAETEEEKAIVALLMDILKPKRLSMTDSLLLLGVDSLVLVEIDAAITERFGVSLNAMDLFEADDIRELVNLVFDSKSTTSA